MNIGEAVCELKRGCKVARTEWDTKGTFLELQVPDVNSKMTCPYLFMETIVPGMPNARTPWVANYADVLANDWYIFI
jgi:hypothetical protein